MTDRPPESVYRVLLPLSLGTLLSLIGDTALYTVLPIYTAEAGVTVASLGILLSANRWVRLLANNGVGWLAERWSRRTLFVLALLIGSLSTGIYAATSGFWPLLIGRLLWGIAWAGIWVTGNAIAIDLSRFDSRGRTVGLYHMSFFLGAGLGAPTGGILTDWLGYRPAMAIAAALTLLGAVIAAVMLPDIQPRKRVLPADGSAPAGDTGEGGPANFSGRWGEIGSIIAFQGVNRLVVAGVLIGTFSLYLSDRLGPSVLLGGRSIGITTISGLALGTGTMLSVLSSPAAGIFSDRLRQRWLVAALGLALGAVGFLALTAASTPIILIGLMAVFLASGSNQGLATALIGDVTPPHRRGQTLGLFYTAGDLTSALGPIIAYGLIDRTGWIAGNYWLAAILSAAMAVQALYWWRRAVNQGRAAGAPPA